MSSQQISNPNNPQQTKKRRRGQSRLCRQTPRYQCYCQKIYLSYPALYLHLKNKHPQCFLNNRKIEVTKFKQTITQQGFKILKMEKENENTKAIDNYTQQIFKHKSLPSFPFQNYSHSFPFPHSQNFMIPNMQHKPYYIQNPIQNNIPITKNLGSYSSLINQAQKSSSQYKQQNQMISKSIKNSKSVKNSKQNIITLLNQYITYISSENQLQKRQSIQVDLLFSLFSKCVKQNNSKLKEIYEKEYSNQGEVIKSFNLQYVQSVIPFFKEKYLPKYIQAIKDDQGKNDKQTKLIKSMIKVSKLFNNLQLANQYVQNFQSWLTHKELYQKNSQKVSLLDV